MRWSFVLVSLLACGGEGDGSPTDAADGCAALCTDAGWSDGVETDFGGGVVECVCEGSGDELAQEDCAAYCDAFGVAAEHAYLSQASSPNDKCVCDGTQSR